MTSSCSRLSPESGLWRETVWVGAGLKDPGEVVFMFLENTGVSCSKAGGVEEWGAPASLRVLLDFSVEKGSGTESE